MIFRKPSFIREKKDDDIYNSPSDELDIRRNSSSLNLDLLVSKRNHNDENDIDDDHNGHDGHGNDDHGNDDHTGHTSPTSSYSESSNSEHHNQHQQRINKHTQIVIEEPETSNSNLMDHSLTSSSLPLPSPLPSPSSLPSSSDTKNNKDVSFSHVNIREFPIQIGDNPSTTKGVPITIGWDHQPPEINISIDEYETIPKRAANEIKMNSLDRMRMLKNCGYSGLEIQKATQQTIEERERRIKTTRNLSWSKWHEVLETIRRAALNATIRKTAKQRERKYLEPWMNNKGGSDGSDGSSTTPTANNSNLKSILKRNVNDDIRKKNKSSRSSHRDRTGATVPIFKDMVPIPTQLPPKRTGGGGRTRQTKFTLKPQDSVLNFPSSASFSSTKMNQSYASIDRSGSSSFATSINMAGEIKVATNGSIRWEDFDSSECSGDD